MSFKAAFTGKYLYIGEGKNKKIEVKYTYRYTYYMYYAYVMDEESNVRKSSLCSVQKRHKKDSYSPGKIRFPTFLFLYKHMHVLGV